VDFNEVIDGVVLLLKNRGRVTYRGLKRQFDLDDDFIEDIKYELIKGMQLAHDEDGEVLVLNDSYVEGVGNNDSTNGVSSTGLIGKTDNAERRQLTVMFCDLVGSTELSRLLDPEELHELLKSYQSSVASEVERYEGHIAQYLGDGILVYFGYPMAHEDDPHRAIHAALASIEAIKEKNTFLDDDIKFRIRIGIHTGMVVVGDVGSGQRTEHLALGDTPNIAARIQGLADPDTIVISQTTHKLVNRHFDFEDLGLSSIKGVDEEVNLFRALNEVNDQQQTDIEQQNDREECVGREIETTLLNHRWDLCKQGRGQVILIGGEPGIGKSRLVNAISKHVTEDDAFRIKLRCSAYHTNSAFYPFVNMLETLMEFSRDDNQVEKRSKLEAFLSECSYPVDESIPIIAALLSISLIREYPVDNYSPDRKKQIVQEVLVSVLHDKAAVKPLLLIWEDLHWADPSTLDVIGLLILRTESERCLCLLTHRPEFRHPWQSHASMTQLFLEHLTDGQIELMVNQMTKGKPLPKELLQQVMLKTDGVPLFVEQIVHQVLESGILQEINGRYEFIAPLDSIAVPMTLQDSLMARLDKSVAAKQLAQLGAALGREFSFELVSAVSGLEFEEVIASLSQLVKIQILNVRGTPPNSSYNFRHALIQDVAYLSVLKKDRKKYHYVIAQVLEDQFNNENETRPELLAHHHTAAGNHSQAIAYWRAAGEIAIRQSAHEEAIAHLRKGLELLDECPENYDKLINEISLQISLGAPLTATKGYCAEEVYQTYRRALTLSEMADDIPHRFRSQYGLWRLHMLRAEYAIAKKQAAELLQLVVTTKDASFPVPAGRAMGATLFYMGEFESSHQHLQHVIDTGAVSEGQSEELITDIYDVVDPRVTCLSYAAWSCWMLGHLDIAAKNMQAAVDLADKLAHPFSIALAQSFASWLHQFTGDREQTQKCAQTALAVSKDQGFKFWVGWEEMMIAWASIGDEQPERLSELMQEGLSTWQETGSKLGTGYFYTLLAQAHLEEGNASKARQCVLAALDFSEKTQEYWWQSEQLRHYGEIALKNDSDEQEAGNYFQRALEVARKQQAKSLELRAAISIGELWIQQGKQQEASNLIGSIVSWFKQGSESKDLKKAAALIQMLN